MSSTVPDTKNARERQAETRSRNAFTSETARKAAEASAEARRAKRQAREATAEQNALTFRQRLGVSLSKLEQSELDGVVKRLAGQGNAQALARLADQAFGRPTEAEADAPTDNDLADLTREQRAVLRAYLDQAHDPSDELVSDDSA